MTVKEQVEVRFIITPHILRVIPKQIYSQLHDPIKEPVQYPVLGQIYEDNQ